MSVYFNPYNPGYSKKKEPNFALCQLGLVGGAGYALHKMSGKTKDTVEIASSGTKSRFPNLSEAFSSLFKAGKSTTDKIKNSKVTEGVKTAAKSSKNGFVKTAKSGAKAYANFCEKLGEKLKNKTPKWKDKFPNLSNAFAAFKKACKTPTKFLTSLKESVVKLLKMIKK